MFGRDPITPFAKLLEPAPRYWGDRGGHLKMDLLKKLYLLTTENVKRAREGRDPAENTKKENIFKVNDLDVTSGAFAPRYTPNYRVVEIHRPNRIVVRDEKGIESVRRSSHLKVGKLKDKMVAMLPDTDEYRQKNGEILHEVEISMVNVSSEHKVTSSTDSVEKSDEILPQSSVKVPVTNVGSEFIVDLRKHGEILPEAATREETEKSHEQ